MLDEKYKTTAIRMNKAGGTAVPVDENLIGLLKLIITEEDDLDFINKTFRRKSSQTMEQLKESSGRSEEELIEKVVALAKKGVMFNQPNRSGVMVYKLMPFVDVGLFEYTFMGPLERNEHNMKLAELYSKMFDKLFGMVQNNYDKIIPMLINQPTVDRTVPLLKNKETGEDVEIIINKDLDVPEEKIIPSQDIEEVVNKFDDIAVGHCFCRHLKDMTGDPCKMDGPRENCFTFGKSARHVAENGFGRLVTKEEAMKIMREAEEAGLIHKAYHPHFDIHKDETSVCNCCNCCCGQAGINTPTRSWVRYISSINQDKCIGCETCIEKCQFDALQMNDNNKAERINDDCMGCGLCAYHCPENAISMIERPRTVNILPPKITN
ncbi:MAG: ATP-binding protein [Promethearchaeota archaeon]